MHSAVLWLLVTAFLSATSCTESSAPVPTAPASTPTAPSLAPPAAPEARFTLTVDSQGSQQAITGLSEVTIDATASTGSELQYVIDFGDGTTATERAARHGYGAAGTYRVTLTVTDSANQTATTSRELIVASPLGAWLYSGYLSRSHSVEVRTLTLAEQDGVTLRGTLSRAGKRDLEVSGTLTADRRIGLRVEELSEVLEGPIPSALTGPQTNLLLVAHGGPANGETLIFTTRPGDPTGPPPLAALRLRFLSFDAPFAIRGISPIEFDASESRGEGLKYFIEFGDHEISTSQSAVHTIADNGSSPRPVNYSCSSTPNFKARLTVVDQFGRSDVDTDEYLVKTLINSRQPQAYYWWEGIDTWIQIETQRATRIAGNFREYRKFADQFFRASFAGTVHPDGNVRLRLDNGDMLIGSVTFGKGPSMTLTRAGGHNDGKSFHFGLRCNY